MMHEMDIDSPNFDPKRYILSMLRSNSIKDLIKKSNQIEQDIKIHDHEIQSLVFENYSKFISSIDTVREMKNNICQVDDKLKTLDSSMEHISELALKIDGKFSVKRKQIQKLDTINKDLQKLKNLCDFPNVLKQDLHYYRSLGQNKLVQKNESSLVSSLFDRSIESYQSCYTTLVSLKDQPLIAPIYKQSVNKIDEVRTILRSLQTQFKNKSSSKILREVTRKLLIMTEDQVSVLRSYFLPWKDRLNELPFKGQKQLLFSNEQSNLNELLSAQIPQLNQGLWQQFEEQLQFLATVKPKLNKNFNEETELLVNNYLKDIFNHVLSVYADAVPMYCTSIKSFVQVNHMIVNRVQQKLKILSSSALGENQKNQKTRKQLEAKLFDKVTYLGKMMLRFLFGRLKLGFLKQVAESRKQCYSIEPSEESLKLTYQTILNPLKDHISTNYKALLNDLEFLQNNFKSVFEGKQQMEQAIHEEVEQLLRAITYLVERQPQCFSEEAYNIINPGYSGKMHRIQKNFIENSVKEYINLSETSVNQQVKLNQPQRSKKSGLWFVVIHYFLNILLNHYGKKLIQNTQSRLQIQSSHDYAKVFTYIKSSISKNLISLAFYYAEETIVSANFKQMIGKIEIFVNSINIIFPETRRGVNKKPSFLSENSIAHQTQILSAKKSPLIDKKDTSDRAGIVSIFIKKLLKQALIQIRRKQNRNRPNEQDIYSLTQICYELSSIQDEGQVCAFYFIIKKQFERYFQWKLHKQDMQNYYAKQRKLIGC